MFNEKFGTITTLLHSQNGDSKILADSEDDEFIDDPMEIDFVQKKNLPQMLLLLNVKLSI